MKIFVTGGTGFIGRHLVRRLYADGHDLLLFVESKRDAAALFDNPQCVEGDLSRMEKHKGTITQFKPEVVIHLAWQGIPHFSIENCIKNLDMGLNLVKFAGDLGCRSFISMGSCWEYGMDKGQLQEDMPTREKNMFTAAKKSLCMLGMQIAKEKGMNFIWPRLFYVYGPGQREGSLIPTILQAIKDGKEPDIRCVKDRNDFIYVGDVADAISLLVKKENVSGIFNIGSGKSTSVREIVEIAYTICGSTTKFEDTSTMHEEGVVDFWANISKIKEKTGWVPQTSIFKGLQKTFKE